jgi:hypothetical protein
VTIDDAKANLTALGIDPTWPVVTIERHHDRIGYRVRFERTDFELTREQAESLCSELRRLLYRDEPQEVS